MRPVTGGGQAHPGGTALPGVGDETVLRDHQGETAIDDGLTGERLLQVSDLLIAQLEGEAGALKAPGPELVQRAAVENIQGIIAPFSFAVSRRRRRAGISLSLQIRGRAAQNSTPGRLSSENASIRSTGR